MYSVSDETRKPIFEGVQGENEAREIQFDVTAWVEELGEGVCTATAKRPTDTTPYPVTVTRSGNVVTWKPNSTDTSIEGIGAFQLAFSINDVVAKTRIWNTKVAPSLVGAGDPPDPYDDWIQDLREIAAETLINAQNAEDSAEDAEAWAVGQRGGVDVPSTDPTYENNAKYYAEQSAENQYGAYIVKSASGDIASFSDGGDDIPMKSLKVAIVPKQAGSGDPSPDNVRPITGTSTANVTVTGKNLFDSARFLEATGWTENNGVYRGADYYIATNHASGFPYLFKFPEPQSRQVCVSFDAKGEDNERNGYMRFEYSDGTQVAIAEVKGTSWTHYTMISNPSKQVVNVNFIYSNARIMEIKNFQIEYASTPTEFEQFGHTTPVPLGQTVYGGEVDVASGELKITQVGVDLSSLSWSGSSVKVSSSILSVVKKPSGNNIPANVIAEKYKTSAVAPIAGNDGKIGVGADGRMQCGSNETPSGLLVYELATPTTVQLTPAQVASLLGTNNVWADCGAVEVEYRADPTLAYNELANVIVSLGGNI